MPAKSTSVTDVTDRPLISVTRAHARASGGDNGEPVTSVTIRHGAVLALDLGTSTGWAFRSPHGHISTGTVSLKHTRYDGGGMRYGRWVQAERAIAKMAEKDQLTGGLMIKTSNGNAIQNPLVGTANKAAADMMRYAAEFGMTPSARSRISAEATSEGADPADRFFS